LHRLDTAKKVVGNKKENSKGLDLNPNNETIELDKVIYGYYGLIGGEKNSYDNETTRRLKSFGEELSRKRTYEKFTTFRADHDDMIIGNHLKLFSFCEHHLLPFFGEVAIGYIPDKKIFGLSKFQRLVDRVASRPQLQERLTYQILEEIKNRLEPKGIGVVVKAIHTCVFARGTQSSAAEFTT
jgi:GTP cyclohydrolase I